MFTDQAFDCFVAITFGFGYGSSGCTGVPLNDWGLSVGSIWGLVAQWNGVINAFQMIVGVLLVVFLVALVQDFILGSLHRFQGK